MKSKGHVAAGGSASRQVKQVPIKHGPRTVNVGSPGGVSQLGGKVSDARAVMKPISGTARKYDNIPYGNEKALNASGTKAKPGADRTVYATGYQDQHSGASPTKPFPTMKDKGA